MLARLLFPLFLTLFVTIPVSCSSSFLRFRSAFAFQSALRKADIFDGDRVLARSSTISACCSGLHFEKKSLDFLTLDNHFLLAAFVDGGVNLGVPEAVKWVASSVAVEGCGGEPVAVKGCSVVPVAVEDCGGVPVAVEGCLSLLSA